MPKKEESGFPLVKLAVCSLSSSVLFYILIALFSFLILKTSGNGSMYLFYGIGAGAVSGFISGFTALKLIKEKGLFYGALCGAGQSVICALIMFILNKGTAGNAVFILIAVMILMSSLGGLAGVNLKKKIKY